MSIRKIQFALILICTLSMAAAKAYDYDPNDFATEVTEYVAGDMWQVDSVEPTHPFNNPTNALGRPTIDTTGDNRDIVPVSTIVPVVIVYPSFRYFELVTIGDGGRLVLKFNHPVRDDENNPYGIDFIVFGNAIQDNGSMTTHWANGNPANFWVNTDIINEEMAIVSVSQDGINWYSYSGGPYSDGFAPTLGRVYDPEHPDTGIGAWNLWWGQATNPTLPLDPAITAASFDGKSVGGISQMYGRSSGGTGYDLQESGFEWIQYVKIESWPGGNSPEVDAVSDVSCCGDWKHPFPAGDITHDCNVNYEDIAKLAEYWLEVVTGPEDEAAAADIYGDNIINFKDWAMMAGTWLESSWQGE
jgi:hypothetical protein